MRHQAGHDALTGLPNRALFRDYLDHALARARRADGMAAVLLLDLDRFKGINDAFGLPCGDLLLKAVAERLQACLRETDAIGRLGGDEFADPADRRPQRRRAAQPGAPPDRQLRPAVRAQRRGAPHQRQHRHHAVPGRRPGRRPAAQERRARDVSGQVERPQRQLLLRPADEPGGAPHRSARARAAPGLRRRPVHGPLPAAARPRERPDRRHRGAAALAPSAARHGPAERVRRSGRGHRPDRAADRARARPRLPPAPPLAARRACRRCACRSTCRRCSSAKARRHA